MRLAETKGRTGRGEKSSNRRLAAVLHADVVGYSRLMAADEAGTHERLVAWRAQIFERLSNHHGRVVGTAGDAVLAVFDSVVDALAAAVEIQAALAEMNAPLPDTEKLLFRIGLNIGDIIVDGDDVFGNGVNVAARVEALADPGGVAITSVVREQVGNKLPLTFEDRGAHHVKNIDTPLQVFAVHATTAAGKAPRRKALPWRTAIAAVVGLVLAASLAFVFMKPDIVAWTGAAGDGQTAVLTSDQTRPTVAVLPFENRSGDAAQEYFSDGVTEDIIAALGRFSGLLVLSWSAVEAAQNSGKPALEAVSALGANYLVSGSVQRSGDQIRLTVQLSNASTGVLIWSDRYDEAVINLFEVQDRMTRQVVAALAVRVTQAEEERVAVAPTESLTAFDLVLRGRGVMHRISREANSEARELFERAIALDDRYADAYVELGLTHLDDLKFGWTQWPQRAWEAARSHADKAISLDPFSAPAYALKAATSKFEGQLAEAERTIDISLSHNPNLARSHAEKCSILMFAGRSEEAISSAEMALAIDPFPRGDEINCPVVSLYTSGRFQAVLDLAAQHPLVSKDEAASLFVIAAAHAMLDQTDEAQALIEEGLSRYPFFNPEGFAGIFASQEQQQIILEGLRRAGL